ncbi:MAG: tRNA (adenosine(37)-N6)-dimethylallyltransferase MiaA [bacterium]|nr:tRNA (adenosine(37)-N6)-dimethylallyltransferase MiaA [bacterium]
MFLESPQIWVLCGPTGVGKTEFSINLALKLGAEIICLDAFQVYRDIPILSACPSQEEYSAVAHHLYEIIEPDRNFSIAEYYDLAVEKIIDCWRRQVTPLLVGGTGLYLKVLYDGFEQRGFEQNPKLREDLQSLAEQEGRSAVYKILVEKNPVRAAELHPNDLKRVIRSIEISDHSDAPKQTRNDLKRFCPMWRKVCLMEEREILYNGVNKRVEKMISRGVEAEVDSLLKRNINDGFTICQAIGFPETRDYIEGLISKADWVERFQRNTRRFLKRQLTWYRSMKDLQLIWQNQRQECLELLQK